MKKKTKTVIGVILAVALVAVLVVVGFMTYLGITWTMDRLQLTGQIF